MSIPSGPPQQTRTRTPDPYEKAIIAFAVRWQYYGGGHATEIFEEFGLSEEAYFRKLLGWVTTETTTDLDPSTRQRITTICFDRIDRTPRRSPKP